MKDYNITCADADGLWSETKTSIPYERVDNLLADLKTALMAKENK